MDDKTLRAFEEKQAAISSSSALCFAHLDVTHLESVSDASSAAVEATLYQMVDNTPVPIYHVKTLLNQNEDI